MPWLVALGLVLLICGIWLLVAANSDEPTAETAPTVTNASGDTNDSIIREGTLSVDGIVPAVVLFIDRSGDPDRSGRISIIEPDGTRTVLPRPCARFAAAAGQGVCVGTGPSLFSESVADIFDPTTQYLRPTQGLLSGFPGRAAVSPDGSLASISTWTARDGYQPLARRNTEVWIVDNTADESEPVDLRSFTRTDSNRGRDQFWAVTFGPDNNTFWVTAIRDGVPEIMQGRFSDRTLEPTGIAGSEPSISPDGSTLVYVAPEGALMAHNLRTDVSIPLGEEGPIEDQPTWADHDTVLYATADNGQPADRVRSTESPSATFTIWALDVALNTTPRVFAEDADAPAVYRG